MTILTLRRIRQHRFEVTGPDIEPVTFKTQVEARDWCLTQYPGSPIREVGGRKRGIRRQRWLRPNWLKFWSAAPT